jgi:hypothetical protein
VTAERALQVFTRIVGNGMVYGNRRVDRTEVWVDVYKDQKGKNIMKKICEDDGGCSEKDGGKRDDDIR